MGNSDFFSLVLNSLEVFLPSCKVGRPLDLVSIALLF